MGPKPVLVGPARPETARVLLRRPDVCFFSWLFFVPSKNAIFSAGRLRRPGYNTTKEHLVKYDVVSFVCFSLKQKDVFQKNSLSNPKTNPDVVQRAVADVGHASDLSAAIVTTCTAHTAVVSQKRENISGSDNP